MEKVIYETQWVQRDSKKEYPHGYGFSPVYVEFPQDADPVWCSKMCREKLSNEEFICINAIPVTLISSDFAYDYPKINLIEKQYNLLENVLNTLITSFDNEEDKNDFILDIVNEYKKQSK